MIMLLLKKKRIEYNGDQRRRDEKFCIQEYFIHSCSFFYFWELFGACESEMSQRETVGVYREILDEGWFQRDERVSIHVSAIGKRGERIYDPGTSDRTIPGNDGNQSDSKRAGIAFRRPSHQLQLGE